MGITIPSYSDRYTHLKQFNKGYLPLSNDIITKQATGSQSVPEHDLALREYST